MQDVAIAPHSVFVTAPDGLSLHVRVYGPANSRLPIVCRTKDATADRMLVYGKAISSVGAGGSAPAAWMVSAPASNRTR